MKTVEKDVITMGPNGEKDHNYGSTKVRVYSDLEEARKNLTDRDLELLNAAIVRAHMIKVRDSHKPKSDEALLKEAKKKNPNLYQQEIAKMLKSLGMK